MRCTFFGKGKTHVAQNLCNLSYLICQRQDHKKPCNLRFLLHKSVYLKLFWTQLESVHLQGPSILKPCSLRPYVIRIEMLFQKGLQPLVYSKCTTVICFHLKIFQGADQVNYCHSQDYLGLQNVIKWLFFYCTNHNIFSGDFLVWWLIWLKMLGVEYRISIKSASINYNWYLS